MLILLVVQRVSIAKPSSSSQHSTFALLPSFSIPQVISVAPTSSALLMLFVQPTSILLLTSINPTISLLLPFLLHQLFFELL